MHRPGHGQRPEHRAAAGRPPTDTGSSGLAVAKAAVRAGFATGYTHAFGLQECLAALVLAPVIVGVGWRQDMFAPDERGYLLPTGQVVGGHEFALIALDVTRRRVTLLNSWGPGWSFNGRAYLTWADLGTLLADNGDVIALTPPK